MSTTSRPPASAAAVYAAMRPCRHDTPACPAPKDADAPASTVRPSERADHRSEARRSSIERNNDSGGAEVSCDRGQSQPTFSDAEPGEPPASSGSGWGRTGPSTRLARMDRRHHGTKSSSVATAASVKGRPSALGFHGSRIATDGAMPSSRSNECPTMSTSTQHAEPRLPTDPTAQAQRMTSRPETPSSQECREQTDE